MNRAKYILKFLILLTTRPGEMWEYLASDDAKESDPDYMQRNFYLPLLGCMALVIFLCDGFYSAGPDVRFDLQHGMMQMVPRLVAFFVGPYLAMLLLKMLLVRVYQMPHPSKERLHLFVFYSTSFLVALEMLLSLLPSIRFFWFIVVYLLYITWSGSSTYIRVSRGQQWVFGFVSALIIYFSSHFVENLLVHMQG